MPNARLDAPAREHDLSDSTTSSAPTAPAAAPKASIVIPVFNEEGLLQTAVHDLVVRLASELPDVT